MTNPGEFKDLDYVKSIPVEETEGFQALFTTVMGSQDGANFLLQHKYVGVTCSRAFVGVSARALVCVCGNMTTLMRWRCVVALVERR